MSTKKSAKPGDIAICPNCKETFIIKWKNQTGPQKFCTKECEINYEINNGPEVPDIIYDDPLNGMNGEVKAINLYRDLAQKIVTLMRTNRIEKYKKNTRNIILDLMASCQKHLNKELNKNVIEI